MVAEKGACLVAFAKAAQLDIRITIIQVHHQQVVHVCLLHSLPLLLTLTYYCTPDQDVYVQLYAAGTEFALQQTQDKLWSFV